MALILFTHFTNQSIKSLYKNIQLYLVLRWDHPLMSVNRGCTVYTKLKTWFKKFVHTKQKYVLIS